MTKRIFARRTIPLLEKTAIFSITIDGIAKFNVVVKAGFKIKPMAWNKLNWEQHWLLYIILLSLLTLRIKRKKPTQFRSESKNRSNVTDLWHLSKNAGTLRKREGMFSYGCSPWSRCLWGTKQIVGQWEWLFTHNQTFFYKGAGHYLLPKFFGEGGGRIFWANYFIFRITERSGESIITESPLRAL